MEFIKSNWENILKIITLAATLATVVFAYLAIRTSREIANEQIKFNKDMHNQEILIGRPFISCTGNISIFDANIFNLNIAIRNIGRRTLYDLTIRYWALVKEPENTKVVFQEKYTVANQVDTGVEQVFFERLPRTSSKFFIYYKIALDFKDILTNIEYKQNFYYIFPIEQQKYLDSGAKKSVGLFGALIADKEFIDNSLKSNF